MKSAPSPGAHPPLPLDLRRHLRAGQVIPALPLALDRRRRWDERSQAALIRYYVAAGSGGLAVGVHSTQFAIRDPKIGLHGPVLALAAQVARASLASNPRDFVLIAGLCGRTRQARAEAQLAASLGYHAGLLSLGAWGDEPESKILAHCRAIAREIPLVGFYLQPAVGGRVLSYRFWRQFAAIPGLVAVKIAPFNRYRTLDVVRAVLEAGRDDVALYTGNDDNIIADLLTPFTFAGRTRHIDGGLLGQWGVWTERAVALLDDIKRARKKPRLDLAWLDRNAALTDANAAIFDAAHDFAGCLPGIHEVLRRQGLLQTTACLDPQEKLSPGQAAALTRVSRAYPWLVDDDFVAQHRDTWRR
ncbi:MAG: dihydrodipicolinate synthase family protein [Opitutaceae bacterium]|nr:dihydrodipicolinate synthase family protein [Opitutaceae bacterium]